MAERLIHLSGKKRGEIPTSTSAVFRGIDEIRGRGRTLEKKGPFAKRKASIPASTGDAEKKGRTKLKGKEGPI